MSKPMISPDSALIITDAHIAIATAHCEWGSVSIVGTLLSE